MIRIERKLALRMLAVLALGSGALAVMESCMSKPEREPVDPATMALDQGCRNATPSATIEGMGSTASPVSYNPGDCYKGYVVQINHLQRGGSGGMGPGTGRVQFNWGTGGVDGRSACESAWLGAYIFEKQSDGTFAAVDVKATQGIWSDTAALCAFSSVDTTFAVPLGETYKVAASARVTPTSSAATRQVTVTAGF